MRRGTINRRVLRRQEKTRSEKTVSRAFVILASCAQYVYKAAYIGLETPLSKLLSSRLPPWKFARAPMLSLSLPFLLGDSTFRAIVKRRWRIVRCTFSRHDVRRDKKFSMFNKSSLEIELEIFYYLEYFQGKNSSFCQNNKFFYSSSTHT